MINIFIYWDPTNNCNNHPIMIIIFWSSSSSQTICSIQHLLLNHWWVSERLTICIFHFTRRLYERMMQCKTPDMTVLHTWSVQISICAFISCQKNRQMVRYSDLTWFTGLLRSEHFTTDCVRTLATLTQIFRSWLGTKNINLIAIFQCLSFKKSSAFCNNHHHDFVNRWNLKAWRKIAIKYQKPS